MKLEDRFAEAVIDRFPDNDVLPIDLEACRDDFAELMKQAPRSADLIFEFIAVVLRDSFEDNDEPENVQAAHALRRLITGINDLVAVAQRLTGVLHEHMAAVYGEERGQSGLPAQNPP